jgi:hypothetical protein
MRDLWRWLAVAAVLVACSGRNAGSGRPEADGSGRTHAQAPDAATPGKDASAMTTPSSTLERLQAWVGPNLGVNPWHDVKVPGVELYYAGNTIEHRGIAVVTGVPDPLTGKEAFRAVRDRGIADPARLASLALLLLAHGEKPILDPSSVTEDLPEVRKLVRAPAIHGNVLEVWSFDQRGETLVRYRIDLGTLEISSQLGQTLVAPRDPIEVALQHLAGPTDSMNGAIDMLVAACTDPRAAPALNNVIAKHKHAEARAWAAFQSPNCRDGKTVAVLIAALEKDADAKVRKHAADALGKLGAKEARAALEKAQRDPDLDVAGAAGRALKKLP